MSEQQKPTEEKPVRLEYAAPKPRPQSLIIIGLLISFFHFLIWLFFAALATGDSLVFQEMGSPRIVQTFAERVFFVIGLPSTVMESLGQHHPYIGVAVFICQELLWGFGITLLICRPPWRKRDA